MNRELGWFVLAAAVTSAAAGCGGASSNTRRLVAREATGLRSATSQEDHSRCDATRPGRTASEYDTNGDGVPDVRKVYQTMGQAGDVHSVLVCREVDLNHDGVKDVFRFYNDEGRTLREEEDRDFDGRIDVISYFENGEIVKQELDNNGDGQVDMRIYFRDHRPFRAERELQHDNSPDFHPDYWEFYDARGHVVRIGWDYDHDGRADRWDRVDRVAPLRVASAAANTTGSAASLAAATAAATSSSGAGAPAAGTAPSTAPPAAGAAAPGPTPTPH